MYICIWYVNVIVFTANIKMYILQLVCYNCIQTICNFETIHLTDSYIHSLFSIFPARIIEAIVMDLASKVLFSTHENLHKNNSNKILRRGDQLREKESLSLNNTNALNSNAKDKLVTVLQ